MSGVSITANELVTFDDGFQYYWPEGCNGAFSSANLREIADWLDSINKPWSDDIDKYFKVCAEPHTSTMDKV